MALTCFPVGDCLPRLVYSPFYNQYQLDINHKNPVYVDLCDLPQSTYILI